MTPQKACRFVLKFGKHKGKTLGQIYLEDRRYITEFLQCIDWKNRPEYQRRTTQSHVCSLLYYIRHGYLTCEDGSGKPAPEVPRAAEAFLAWEEEKNNWRVTEISE